MGNARYVYLIESEDLKLTKIGIAVNPRLRLSELQTGSPSRLRLRYVLSSADPEKLERTLHHLLADAHHHGEWFSLLADDIHEQIKGRNDVQTIVTGDNWRPKPYDFTPKVTTVSKSNANVASITSITAIDKPSELVYIPHHHVTPEGVNSWSQDEYGRTLRNHWKWQTEHDLKFHAEALFLTHALDWLVLIMAIADLKVGNPISFFWTELVCFWIILICSVLLFILVLYEKEHEWDYLTYPLPWEREKEKS